MNHLFCFGFGYVAQHLANHLQTTEPWIVSGTHRSHQDTHNDYHLYVLDQLTRLPADITHILISIPPDEQGDIAFARFHSHIKYLKNLQGIFLLSSTGVYGDHQGEWVTENSALITQQQRSRLRIKAEQQWLTTDLPIQVLRLSAIYGPMRNELIKAMKGQSQAIIKQGHYFSRIHVDDIVCIISGLMQHPANGEIFNLSDDLPSAQVEVVRFAHQLLELPPLPEIPYEEAELSEMMKLFYSENKRVSNEKIKQHLNLQLKYPTFKEGLRACMRVDLRS